MIQRQPNLPADLTQRQGAILKLIIQEHVTSGRPVGSKGLTERYPIGVSAATIRHEMVELEAAGYLQHLHTSGGRVPTDRGYRYYVHHLMENVELPSVERIMISHQFRQVEVHLDQWMELAAKVLAESAGNVSVVTAPRPAVPRLRHFELIALQPRLALLIVVTQESIVRQVMIHWPNEVDQETLSGLADRLVPLVRGMTSDELIAQAVIVEPSAHFVLDQLEMALRGLEATERIQVRHSGLENIFGQPEFAGTEMLGMFDLLRGGGFLSTVLPQLAAGPEVQVFIGDENEANELRRFGVVVAAYGVDSSVTGVLGVIGPTRMSYLRSISSVRYMASLMSELMADLYSA